MDKRVIFAVAGSGKTTYLINQLNESERFLLITYTNNNVFNLRTGIIKKFGYFPDNIKVFSYYSFLYKFCYKPFLQNELKTKGINYSPNTNKYAKGNSRAFYIDRNDRLYSARISKFLKATKVEESVIKRIAKYFDHLFIDEVQDFGGNDFNFLKSLTTSLVNHLYVGDFFQHTFDTSRDGTINSKLHDDYNFYIKEFEKMGMDIDRKTLSKSFRCSPNICEFITSNLGIQIFSNREDSTTIEYIESKNRASEILANQAIVKLFYQQHYIYNCFSRNWGDSKGEDKYHDVCVVLNKKSHDFFKKGKLDDLPPMTKNKLYVAISRSKNNLYLVPDTLLK